LVRFLGLEVRSEKFEDLTVTMGLAGSRRIDRIASERDAVAAYLSGAPLPDVPRLLFLGTSQMQGSGAYHVEERIAQSVQRVLSEDHGWNTVVINAAKSGSRSGELLARYQDHLGLLEPTLVLVNLSSNDGSVKVFERNLQAIVDVGRRLRTATVFVKEANSPELEDAWLRKKHAAVSRVASKNQVPVIDLHGHLSGADLHDSGILWWDPVHMTSYGQARTAELLAENIAGILRAQGAGLLDQIPRAFRSRQRGSGG
jgi:lysophospholipase L1-like esterase